MRTLLCHVRNLQDIYFFPSYRLEQILYIDVRFFLFFMTFTKICDEISDCSHWFKFDQKCHISLQKIKIKKWCPGLLSCVPLQSSRSRRQAWLIPPPNCSFTCLTQIHHARVPLKFQKFDSSCSFTQLYKYSESAENSYNICLTKWWPFTSNLTQRWFPMALSSGLVMLDWI